MCDPAGRLLTWLLHCISVLIVLHTSLLLTFLLTVYGMIFVIVYTVNREYFASQIFRVILFRVK